MGTSCSGKSSLSRRISERLGMAHTELDALFWKPDWCPRPREEFHTLVTEVVRQQVWLLDGNYGSARDIILPRATAVIWLNYSFRLVMWRALRRTIPRVFKGEELFSGNRESFKRAFISRNSMLWWVVTTFRRRRREYQAVFRRGDFPHLGVVELKRPADADRLLQSLQADAPVRRDSW